MRTLLWGLALCGALAGGAVGILAIAANPPLAQAQVAALICLWAAIAPYCAARAWDELTRDRKARRRDDFSAG